MSPHTANPAQRKPRSFLRACIRKALIVVLALLLYVGYIAIRIGTASPGKPGMFTPQLTALALEGQDQTAPNLWPLISGSLDQFSRHYADAFAAKYPNETVGTPDWSLLHAPDAVEPDPAKPMRPVLLDALARMETAGLFTSLAPLRDARHVFRPITAESLWELHTRDNTPIYACLRVLIGRMAVAADAGDWPKVVESYALTLSLARACSLQPLHIDFLIGAKCRYTAGEKLREILTEHAADEHTLAALDAETLKHPLADVVKGLKGDFILAHDAINLCYTDDGRGDGFLYSSKPIIGEEMNMVGRFRAFYAVASKKETLDALESHRALIMADRAEPLNLRSRMNFRDAIRADPSPKWLVLGMVAPMNLTARNFPERNDLCDIATRLVIAIERFRLKHQSYPRDLKELVPAFLPAVPPDPFGGEWSYIRRTPTKTDSRGYLLYAWGPDAQDNGGSTSDDCATGMTPGTDYIANPLRPISRGSGERIEDHPRAAWRELSYAVSNLHNASARFFRRTYPGEQHQGGTIDWVSVLNPDMSETYPDAPSIPIARAALAEFDRMGLFTHLKALREISRYENPPIDLKALDQSTYEFSTHRGVTRMLWARMMFAAADKRWDVFTESVECAAILARACLQSPDEIGWLVGHSIAWGTLQRIRETAAVNDLDPHTIDTLTGLTWSIPLDSPAMKFKRFLALNGAHAKPSLANSIERQLEPVVNWMNRPFKDRNPDELAKLMRGFPIIEDQISRNLLNAIQSAANARDQLQTEVHGAAIMLAIKRREQQVGALPDTLSQLAPEFIASVPPDAFADGWGYTRRTPDAHDPRAFILYSFGMDGADNKGRTDPTNWNAFTPEKCQGFDYILNPLPHVSTPPTQRP